MVKVRRLRRSRQNERQGRHFADGVAWLVATAGLLATYREVIASCSVKAAALPGDATSATIWQGWVAANAGWGYPAQLPMVNWPDGELDSSLSLLNVAFTSVNSLVASVLNPVCSYNVISITNGVLLLVSLSALLHKAGVRSWVATLLSGSFVLGPWFYLVASSNLPWTFAWMPIAGLALQISERHSRNFARVTSIAVLYSLPLLVDPYLAVSSLVLLAVGTVYVRSQPLESRAATSVIFTPAALVGGFIFLFVAFLLQSDLLLSSDLPARPQADFFAWSARPEYWFLPDTSLPPYSWLPTFLPSISSGESVPASGLFVGILAPSLFGLAGLVFLTDSSFRSSVQKQIALPLGPMHLALTLICLGVLFSLPPSIPFGEFQVPTPTMLLSEFGLPLRVTMRFGFIAHVGITLLSGLVANLLLQSSSTVIRRTSGGMVLALFSLSVGLAAIAGRPVFDYLTAPDPYQWLAEQPSNGNEGVADLLPFPDIDASFATWQVIHEWPVSNPRMTRNLAHEAMVGFVHPQTACIANVERVKYLLRHSSEVDSAKMDYLTLVKHFRLRGNPSPVEGVSADNDATREWNDIDVYTPTDSMMTTPAFLGYGVGFLGGTFENGRGVAQMNEETAILTVTPMRGSSGVRLPVALDVLGPSTGIRLTVQQEGEILWSGEVGQDWQRINFSASPLANIVIQKTDVKSKEDSDVYVGRFGVGDCI